MKFQSCGFIAHDPNRFRFGLDEEDERCIMLKMVLLQQIQLLCQKGICNFSAVCTHGAELWCGELVNKLRKENNDLNLYCILPYEECATKWPPYLRERFFDLLEVSTYTTMIDERKTRFSLLKAYLRLIDNSDILLAVYTPASIRGDAADLALLYAIGKGKPLITIHPETFNISYLDTKKVDVLQLFEQGMEYFSS